MHHDITIYAMYEQDVFAFISRLFPAIFCLYSSHTNHQIKCITMQENITVNVYKHLVFMNTEIT